MFLVVKVFFFDHHLAQQVWKEGSRFRFAVFDFRREEEILSPLIVGVAICAIFVSLLSGLPVTWRCEVLRVCVGGSFLKIGTTMEVRWGWRAVWIGVVAVSFFLSAVGGSESPALKAGQTPASAFEAVKDTMDVLVESFGWKKDEVKLGSIDTKDAKVGQTLIYEFDIQVGDVVVPLRLSEEVTSWQYLQELPAPLSDSEPVDGGDTKERKEGAIDVWQPEAFSATLAPFEVAGPVDLWIQDAKELRLSMPHDVDAGLLKRVLLAEGAVVSIKGAREVSLSRPLQLPLPLSQGPQGKLAASLVALAARLRAATRGEEKPLLSLRIVGPSSLTAVAMPTESSGGKLKVKRLGSGAVELRSQVAKKEVTEEAIDVPYSSLTLADNLNEPWMWPLPSINMSKLVGLEQALVKTLGPKAYQRGSFQLLNAKVSAASFVQMEFEVEKAVNKEDLENEEIWPEWATKPTVDRLQFQVLMKVEGNRLRPVSVQHLESVLPMMAISPDYMSSNVSSKMPPILTPPGAMTLDVDLEGLFD